MPGFLRLRWGRRLLLLLYNRYGFDLYHATLSNHMLPHIVSEIVIGPLEFGFAQGDELVAIVKLHEILVLTTAEDGQTYQKCQSQITFDSGRAHFRL